MAVEEGKSLDFSLQAPIPSEQWKHLEAEVEEKDSSNHKPGLDKTPRIIWAGSIRESLQRRPEEEKKQNLAELLQQLEAQVKVLLETVIAAPSGWGAPQLPEEHAPWDDVRAFLASFEQVAKACQWPKEEWVARLQPALSGEAKQAFLKLEARTAENYMKVKAAILQGAAVRREKWRQNCRHVCYQEAEGPRAAYNRLLECWASLLSEIRSWVQEHGPETCSQAVALDEDFLQRQTEAKEWWPQWVPAAFVDVTMNSSEAEQALSDDGLSKTVEQENREVTLCSDGQANERERENNKWEEPEQIKAFQKRAREQEESTTGDQGQLKEQRRNCHRNKICKVVTYNESLNTVHEIPQQLERNVRPKSAEGFKQVSGLIKQGTFSGSQETTYQCVENDKRLGCTDQIRPQRIRAKNSLCRCTSCGRTFNRRLHLLMHKRVCKSSQCPETSNQCAQRLAHQRTHARGNV